MPESRNRGVRILVILCIFSLVIYFGLFSFIEHWRVAGGPWKVTFTTGPASAPVLRIEQSRFHITNVEILFNGKSVTATNVTREFTRMQAVPFALPFGQCKFQDLTTRPGTVVLDVYGHEIQLMPHSLTVDKQVIPWKQGERIVLN